MTPQQNGRLSLTGNKRPAPQQKEDAKQGSILDYYNWPSWPALNKSKGSGHLTLWLSISFMVRLPLSNIHMQILHTVTFGTFFKGYGYTLPFAAFLTMDIWNTAPKKGKIGNKFQYNLLRSISQGKLERFPLVRTGWPVLCWTSHFSKGFCWKTISFLHTT